MPHPKLKRLISSRQIAKRLNELGREVPRSIPPGERPIAIIVLQGAFIFGADLLRRLPSNYSIDVAFLRCQSYGSEMQSSGHVLLLQDLDPSIQLRGRTVLLVDDILDSGLTLRFLTSHLKRRGAKRIRLCVLLRRNALKPKRLEPDFAGFSIGPEFVVGYGLDFDGKYRHLPDLYAMETK
jgi:hypoxanthine phosphoribosyltransferase